MIEQYWSSAGDRFWYCPLTDAATATMVGAGTPAYMAPEQVKGLDPVPQTDIYALGIILYEMLAGGERPFTGERATTTGTTSAKVRWEQVNLSPPSLKDYIPDIPSALDDVVLKCLKKEPQNRFQNSLELQNALEIIVGRSEIIGSEQLEQGSRLEKPGQIPATSIHQQLTRGSMADSPLSRLWKRWGGWIGGAAALILAISGVLLILQGMEKR